jgi:hypothetical protein
MELVFEALMLVASRPDIEGSSSMRNEPRGSQRSQADRARDREENCARPPYFVFEHMVDDAEKDCVTSLLEPGVIAPLPLQLLRSGNPSRWPHLAPRGNDGGLHQLERS